MFRLAAATATALAALTLAACGSSHDDWSEPHTTPAAVGALSAGFVSTKNPPAPESTVTPRPGSWDGTHPAKGYRVVLLQAGHDKPTSTMATAVTDWAGDVQASLKTVHADDPGRLVPSISKAMALKPDIIISVGNALVDPLALVTANHLGQQFLVIGAEVAEPTANVTAADWSGASFRGEGLGMPEAYDARTFTPERAARAVRAGIAAVINHITGVVIRIR